MVGLAGLFLAGLFLAGRGGRSGVGRDRQVLGLLVMGDGQAHVIVFGRDDQASGNAGQQALLIQNCGDLAEGLALGHDVLDHCQTGVDLLEEELTSLDGVANALARSGNLIEALATSEESLGLRRARRH